MFSPDGVAYVGHMAVWVEYEADGTFSYHRARLTRYGGLGIMHISSGEAILCYDIVMTHSPTGETTVWDFRHAQNYYKQQRIQKTRRKVSS